MRPYRKVEMLRPRKGDSLRVVPLPHLLQRLLMRLKEKEQMQFVLGSKKNKEIRTGKRAELDVRKFYEGKSDYHLRVRHEEEKTLKETTERFRGFIDGLFPTVLPQTEPITRGVT